MGFSRVERYSQKVIIVAFLLNVFSAPSFANPNILIPDSLKSQWLSPIEGFYVINSFAEKNDQTKTKNPGVDIVAIANPVVIAPKAGLVIVSAKSDPFYPGHKNIIVIDHGDKILTLYSGVERRRVESGEWVVHGQKIAKAKKVMRNESVHRVGKKNATHIEVIYKGERVDPFKLLPYMFFEKKFVASGL